MRLALLVPVLICVAAPAHAEGARESRYGPTTPSQTTAAAAAARYDGPMLGWANKRQTSTAAAPPETSPARPAPLTNWAGYQATPAPAAYTPPPVSITPAPPTSLYATPRAAPTSAAPAPIPVAAPVARPVPGPAPAKDWSSYRSTRMTGVAPAAVTPPPPAAPPRQVAAADTGGTRARYYSVDREYGLTPDAVPPPGPDTRVLISAGEPPPEAKDATPVHGSADWLAGGVTGDDEPADDSASRRAKTRNEAL